MVDHSSSATTSSSSSQRGGARELQGPRPAPLKVRKDSHKIRKPPPPQTGPEPPGQVRQPVIIYMVSPKVVHANPSEFMSVVQRLTGARTASSSSLTTALPPAVVQPTLPFPFQLQAAGPHDGALQLSPAARLAAVEQARSAGGDTAGGLSPLPGLLPASFFSPPDGGAGGSINLLGELISPAFLGHYNSFVGGSTNTGATPMLHKRGAPSPSPSGADAYYWDLFNCNQQYHPNPNL